MATLIQELGEAIRDSLRANATFIAILGQTDSVTNIEYADQPSAISPNYGGAGFLRFERVEPPIESDYEDSGQSTFLYAFAVTLQDVAGAGTDLGLCATAIRSVFINKGKSVLDTLSHVDSIGGGTITISIDADPLDTLTDRDMPIVLASIAVKLWHAMPLTT